MTRAHKLVVLDWADRVGFIRRSLPIDRFCTQCGSPRFKRLDTHEKCEHRDYVPVQCMSCTPSESTWRALPKKPGTDEADAPRRSLRARVKGFVTALVGRRA